MTDPVFERLHQLMSVREEVESLSTQARWMPAADWLDDGAALTLLVDLPGVSADALHMQAEEDYVLISGERPALETLYSERPYGSFSRQIGFPEAVVPHSAQATLQAGVLMVRFEKVHPTIDVQAQDLDSV